jgi:protein SCO1/2
MHRALACLLWLLFASAALAANDGNALKAGTFSPPRMAPEFSLAGSDGAELKLQRYRGKVVLLAFGFTHCTEVCPVTLAVLAQARKQLGASAGEMQVVYITVDPERDSPARMREYLAAFDPSFVGGTGAPGVLAAVRKDYGVSANKIKTASGYVVDHSSSIYLIDREGKLRAMMPYSHPPADFAHDVSLLLKK